MYGKRIHGVLWPVRTYWIAGRLVTLPVCPTLGDLTGHPIGYGIQTPVLLSLCQGHFTVSPKIHVHPHGQDKALADIFGGYFMFSYHIIPYGTCHFYPCCAKWQYSCRFGHSLFVSTFNLGKGAFPKTQGICKMPTRRTPTPNAAEYCMDTWKDR